MQPQQKNIVYKSLKNQYITAKRQILNVQSILFTAWTEKCVKCKKFFFLKISFLFIFSRRFHGNYMTP